MRHGLLVLGLRERVDGADLLASAGQPLEPARQRLALLGGELRGGGLGFELEATGEAVQLLRGFVDPVAGAAEANLALGQALVALAQLPVQCRLLLGALLELRRDMLAGLAVGAELELEPLAAPEIALATCSSEAITARTSGSSASSRVVAARRRSIRAWRSSRSRCSRSRAARAADSSADTCMRRPASGRRPGRLSGAGSTPRSAVPPRSPRRAG